MVREFYKMIHKKCFFALVFLLLIPLLFGVGYFFNLQYMIDGNNLSVSALDYCAEMQILIKYFYFLVVIFLACDIFSSEFEGGQLRMVIVHMTSRKKIILQKFTSLCLMTTIFHVLFWGFNFGIYGLCSIKNNISIVILSKNIEVYIGIFFGYLEAFFICIAITFFIGLFLRKIYALVIVYFVWFAFRYVDQIVSMKSVFPEFMADYLSLDTNSVASINMLSYVIGILLCITIILISTCLFQYKDIN